MTAFEDNRSLRRTRKTHIGVLLLLSFVSTSCASLYVEQLAQVSANSQDFHVSTELGVDACRSALQRTPNEGAHELDPKNIRLVNWNAQKTSKPSWQQDYQSLADGMDLVLIQEASLREDTITYLDAESGDHLDDESDDNTYATKHWSFAPGYRTEGQISGVLTLSKIKPLTQCSFVTLEPVFRTPKATSITQYALTATEETLVVVNVHAVNFSLGLGAFQAQFDQITDVLAEHRGPIILSGDFNTWRTRRMLIVDAVAESIGLESLEFEEDHRVKVFGKTLDHIYVRGLSAISTDVRPVTTSDHNPMSVTLTN